MWPFAQKSVDLYIQPLIQAIKENNISAVEKLLDENLSLIRSQDREFGTALHRAAIMARKEIAEVLISRGADVQARRKEETSFVFNVGVNLLAEFAVYGDTSLHYAAESGQIEVAGLLIRKGADVNARNESGKTPLHIAALLGQTAIAELLISKGANVMVKTTRHEGYATPLHCAAQNGRI